MSTRHLHARAAQRGLVLISSLLLLLVVTILALAMFRSTGLGEKISGNVREKQRALHAAEVAEQFAEWWLSSPGNSSQPTVVCNAPASANAAITNVLICSHVMTHPETLPWTLGGHTVGFSYYPNVAGSPQTTMNFTPDASGSGANQYVFPPSFLIQYVGAAKDGAGNVYRIDAVGYGGNEQSVAVVEAMYEIGSAVQCKTCL